MRRKASICSWGLRFHSASSHFAEHGERHGLVDHRLAPVERHSPEPSNPPSLKCHEPYKRDILGPVLLSLSRPQPRRVPLRRPLLRLPVMGTSECHARPTSHQCARARRLPLCGDGSRCSRVRILSRTKGERPPRTSELVNPTGPHPVPRNPSVRHVYLPPMSIHRPCTTPCHGSRRVRVPLMWCSISP